MPLAAIEHLEKLLPRIDYEVDSPDPNSIDFHVRAPALLVLQNAHTFGTHFAVLLPGQPNFFSTKSEEQTHFAVYDLRGFQAQLDRESGPIPPVRPSRWAK